MMTLEIEAASRARVDVVFFCEQVLGSKYSDLKKNIYPNPSYRGFFLKKRSGGFREIYEPRRILKNYQHQLLQYLYSIEPRSKLCVHGFVKKRSIVTNALAHLSGGNPTFVLNLDLKNFFPSITFFRVRGVFQKNPFNFSFELSTVLAQLCTFNGQLPQGAPTSPYIANLVCRGLDRDLMALAKRQRANYTRYADDITFSFSVRDPTRLPPNLCIYDGGLTILGEELLQIIHRHTFQVHEGKTRIASRYSRQEVTGITINSSPNVRRLYIDKIRGALHAWEIYGYDAADTRWGEMISLTISDDTNNPVWSRQTRDRVIPKLSNLLWGRLLYLKMVRGSKDILYTRLAEKYNKLLARDKRDGPSLPVSCVVKNHNDIKHAVFIIEIIGDAPLPGSINKTMIGAQATAFSYKSPTTLITCGHVFTMSAEDNGITFNFEFEDVSKYLELKVIDENLKEWKAVLLHRDRNLDLAVLKLIGNTEGLRYFSNVAIAPQSNQPCTLTGFPNWNSGRPIDIQRTSITNVFPRAGLRRIEIATLIRKGNSGGPLINNYFQLLGVAQEGALQNKGNNECLYAEELDQWLDSLKITF
jgi:retron-type reverse transcriptase